MYSNNYLNLSLAELKKLWQRVNFPPNWTLKEDQSSACFSWNGYFDNFGRPSFRLNGKYQPVRIVIFESCHGPLDPGKFVFSNCGDKNCVNPYHLVQSHYFKREVNARGKAKNQDDKRRNLKVTIAEKDVLRAFNGIHYGKSKSISDVAQFLNIDDDLAEEFLRNNHWKYINNIYSKKQLDALRSRVGIRLTNTE